MVTFTGSSVDSGVGSELGVEVGISIPTKTIGGHGRNALGASRAVFGV